MRKILNNKGVTLVALVVTILILIILAGITLKATLGDNGLLNQTNKASFTLDYENVTKNLKLATMKYLSQVSSNEINSSLTEYLYDQGYIDSIGVDKWIINVEKLLGEKISTGNGRIKDYYTLEYSDDKYSIYYYGESESDKTLVGSLEDVDVDAVTPSEIPDINNSNPY